MTSRVLVVEDDHGLRDVVARGLREHGFTVVTAVDGASALRTAASADFDADGPGHRSAGRRRA